MKSILKNLFLMSLVTLIIPFVVNAKDIKVTKTVPGNNGDVVFKIENLELTEGGNYEWGISKNSDSPSEYFALNNFSKDSATVTLSASENSIKSILKITDTVYLTIRNKDDNSTVLKSYKLDVTLPPLMAYKFEIYDGAYYFSIPYGIDGSSTFYYMIEEITDANIINTYIDNNRDLSNLKLKSVSEHPSETDTRWTSIGYYSALHYSHYIYKSKLPSDNKLYYVWVKNIGSEVKTIYGYYVYEAGTVQKVDTTKKEEVTEKQDTTNKTENKTETKTENKAETKEPAATKEENTVKNPNTGIYIGVGSLSLILISMLLMKKKNKFNKV